MTTSLRRAFAFAALAALAACGGGSSPPPPLPPAITWNANHEYGVNSAGGGYVLSIDGGDWVYVPYVSGAWAPTSLTTTLSPGTHTVTLHAYAALDSSGGTTGPGTTSAPTQLTVVVP